ncbi:hypothetical protein A676_02929 [Salmonella enterica subsp. enterica serovar Enteritidis str. 2010K-0262]|uniref:Uncharacterized protein n=2 Tax=Salmonella enterica I TaxID=59201 RepID=M7RI75_SALDU|nr:hypothetical protein A670_03468 [Salmonella enterica subsp. enterica serovar Dublin str. UC16]EPI66583.1 hypothetical protein A673_03531 [Salmonella enterica subsp. enterica serovar Enteritidis str. 2009K0958]EPI68378.1 hypothetical protein A671_03027 [Salmonella enterica subsp. enterica serovar Dublin str. DG22]EPI81592.1 hypothetical protein A676_02929 [Salmonella enterica subsp. enterica serovar Enteritidis str. 2010K-0262]EPI83881.1 hypothetical protein A674_03900 [Salmonella enterica su
MFFLTVRFLSFSHTNHMECLISRIIAHYSKMKRDFVRLSEH